jgi:ATP-dependent Lhr-like helicase
LRATRADAAGGLTDLERIASMLRRVKGRIVHMVLSHVSPLAVPVLLEIGRESVRTRDDEEAMLAEAEAIIAEATGEAEPPHRGVPDRSGIKAINRANTTRRTPAQATDGAEPPRPRRRVKQPSLFDA